MNKVVISGNKYAFFFEKIEDDDKREKGIVMQVKPGNSSNTTPLVDRGLVHKSNPENVFIEEPSRIGAREFRALAHFPVHHGTYNDTPTGLSASGYLIEVARQKVIALSHKFFDIPLDAGFIISVIDWHFSRPTPFVVEHPGPFELFTSVRETAERGDGKMKCATRTRFVGRHGEFLTGESAFLTVSRNMTSRTKRSSDTPTIPVHPLTAEEVQVRSPHNVLIGLDPEDEDVRVQDLRNVLIGLAPAEQREEAEITSFFMVVDRNHPYFFEHENTHVPGMMLLEAGKQAAVFSARRRYPALEGSYGDLRRGEIRFSRFADLKRPIRIACSCDSPAPAEEAFRTHVVVSFKQGKREIGRIEGDLSFVDAAEAVGRSALVGEQANLPPAEGKANG
uniref:A-factor biosynthesis hotdog domain-containing protein n=1 Tax=Candidatus Kentrum sp. LFY TaxID=2126342 RepID=A0A450V056_9GAMM|nr:MAG: A-factor biosynthesis hotdog domain-containing protein [Candidatus Kentron sp. LFY]